MTPSATNCKPQGIPPVPEYVNRLGNFPAWVDGYESGYKDAHVRPAASVADEMIERALAAFYGNTDWTRSLQRDAMKRALTAALSQPATE